MKTFRNGACILAAYAGLLAAPAAWSQGSFGGSYEVRVDKGETLSDFAWQHRREGASPGAGWTLGIARANPEVFPGGNLGQERGDEREAFRAHRERGEWYQRERERGVPVPAPPVHSPR
jgi:hypothetical protein